MELSKQLKNEIQNLKCVEYIPLYLSFFTWFMVGFDFIQITQLLKEIEFLFFASDDPNISILSVYAVLSISLLSRLVGGIVLGYLANKIGIFLITRYALIA